MPTASASARSWSAPENSPVAVPPLTFQRPDAPAVPSRSNNPSARKFPLSSSANFSDELPQLMTRIRGVNDEGLGCCDGVADEGETCRDFSPTHPREHHAAWHSVVVF